MFLNLSQLREELQQRVKNVTISATRLNRWLNMGQTDIASVTDPDNLIVNVPFTTSSQVRKYYLETDFNRVISIVDLDNDLELTQASENELESLDPNISDEGNPYLYATTGISWVKAQPSVASAITIVSSSGADSSTLRINGIVDNVEDTEVITLNGTTPVTGTKLFSEIHSLAKSDVTVGKVTVTAAATTLAEIGPNQLIRQYQPVILWPTPSASVSMSARGIKSPRLMINDEDYPDFPEKYHEAVLVAAEIRGHRELFRPKIAEDIQIMRLAPMLDAIKRDMGNKRRKHSIVLQGERPSLYRSPIGRYGSNFEVG